MHSLTPLRNIISLKIVLFVFAFFKIGKTNNGKYPDSSGHEKHRFPALCMVSENELSL
jgi:hypothetical protein